DGKTLASASRGKTIKLWDVVTGKEKATLQGHTGPVSCVAYSPDGKTLASGSDNEVLNMDSPEGNKSIRLWVVATTPEWSSPEGSWDYVTCVEYSPDGKTLASGTIGYVPMKPGDIRLRDVATGQERVIRHPVGVFSLAFSPDGKTLASGSWNRMIKLWD